VNYENPTVHRLDEGDQNSNDSLERKRYDDLCLIALGNP
jgi:hypothetical protein